MNSFVLAWARWLPVVLCALVSLAANRAGDLIVLGYSINQGPRPLFRVSTATGQTVQSIATSFRPTGFGQDVTDAGLAYGEGGLWVLGKSVNLAVRPLYKVNATDGKILETLPTAFRPNGLGPDVSARAMAYHDGWLWMFGDAPNITATRPLYKVDPKTGQIAETIASAFKMPAVGIALADIGLAAGDGQLWAFGYPVNSGPRPLYQIDPSKGAIAKTIQTEFRPAPLGTDVARLGLAFGNGSLWALGYSVNNGLRPLYQINPKDGKILHTFQSSFRGTPGADVAEAGVAYAE